MRATNRFIKWTKQNAAEAEAESWNIWNSEGSAHGSPQLQRYDEESVFSTDQEALCHVYTKAVAGSELHRKALAVLAMENPSELQVM